MAKGIIAGMLVMGGFFNPSFGAVPSILLFVLGAAVFLDAIMPYSNIMHGFTVFVFTIAGGIAMFALSSSGSPDVFIAIAIIAAFLLFARKVFSGLHAMRK